jgi:pimeloyl-ACP methyl ester carboxylesterase
MMPLNYVGAKILESTPFWVVRSFLSRSEAFLTNLDQEARSQYAADIKRADPNFLRIPADAEDLTPLLPKIPAPTLVIYGTEDHLEYPDSFPRLVEGLANGSGMPVPGCGHHPHLWDPDLVRVLMLNFMKDSG